MNVFKLSLITWVFGMGTVLMQQGCRPAMVESVDSEEQSVIDLLKRFATIEKLSDFDPSWLTGNPVSKATGDFVN